MDVGPGGLDLTPFARQIYKHPDVEVHFVQINVKLAQRQLPLRLAAAGFPRTPIEDGTCPRILEMQLVAVPPEMRRSTFVLPSGQVLFPLKIHHTSQMMVFSCMVGVPYKGQLFIAFSNNQNVYLPMDGW